VLAAIAGAIEEAADELGRVDAIAGDGDHGRGMVKGSSAALTAATAADADGAGVATVLTRAADAWASQAGGTSGVLWGAALAALGTRLGDDRDEITGADVAAAVRAGLDAMTTLGKATVGDKTMVDALVPFADRLAGETAAGTDLVAAWQRAAEDAETAAQATADLKPKVGRARPLAERSLGTPDAGALSFALCVRTAAAVLATQTDQDTAGSTR
jgi:dihydroxyacetone kinase